MARVVEAQQGGVINYKRGCVESAGAIGQRPKRAAKTGRAVYRRAALDGYLVDVAAHGSKIAHKAADEDNILSVGRHTRHRNLKICVCNGVSLSAAKLNEQ